MVQRDVDREDDAVFTKENMKGKINRQVFYSFLRIHQPKWPEVNAFIYL